MSPEPLVLPAADWQDWLAGYVRDRLRSAATILAGLRDGTERDTATVLGLWNDADIALRGAGSTTHLFGEVHPDARVRTLAEELLQDVDRATTDRDLDRELYEVVAATDATGLDTAAQRMREHVLRDFRRSGVDRDDEVRDRLRDISERLTVLEQEFGRTIRDDVRSIRVGAEQLHGLPDDFVADHPVRDGLVTITTDYPDYLPFRTYSRDAQARRDLTIEFESRGWPANDAVLHEIVDLRDEKARLLGYDSWPDYDADVKMIGSGRAIAEFIGQISGAAADAGRRDLQTLLTRRREDDPAATAIDRSELGYYTELVRREQYDVDAREVRRYFDFQRVRAGLLEVTGRLFGVQYRPVEVPRWHEDVAVYDVYADGQRRGRIYLDLHPREGKYKHAAQFDLVGGITDRLLPEGRPYRSATLPAASNMRPVRSRISCTISKARMPRSSPSRHSTASSCSRVLSISSSRRDNSERCAWPPAVESTRSRICAACTPLSRKVCSSFLVSESPLCSSSSSSSRSSMSSSSPSSVCFFLFFFSSFSLGGEEMGMEKSNSERSGRGK